MSMLAMLRQVGLLRCTQEQATLWAGGAPHAVSVGWISYLRKAMQLERAQREGV